jgi:hypothetical protein
VEREAAVALALDNAIALVDIATDRDGTAKWDRP